jgi:macrolide transport system ATP-binding/permease protein
VLVSHDRRLLADVATKVLDLDPSSDGRPRLYGDGYAGYVAGRQAEGARWAQAYDRYLAEQERLAEGLSAAQNRLRSGWRPPKGTGKHQRSTRASSAVRAVHRQVEVLAAHEVTRAPAAAAVRASTPAVAARGDAAPDRRGHGPGPAHHARLRQRRIR